MKKPDKWPGTLSEKSVQHLPACLEACYQEELKSHGLIELACQSNKSGIHGGESEEATNQHFALRFLNSSTRSQFLCLGADGALHGISDALVETFSSHRISVLDIPSGAGASILALLTALANLRKEKLLPSLPLVVDVCAADISSHALGIYQSMQTRLAPHLKAYGIEFNLKTQIWDIEKSDKTSQLCDEWFNCQLPNEYVVLVSNMSGFGKAGFEKFRRSIEHIAERLSGKASTILWIEPGIDSSQGFLKKVSNFFLEKILWFEAHEEQENVESHSYRWWHFLLSKELPGKLAVQHFQRAKDFGWRN